MTLTKTNYKNRLIDRQISQNLKIFGAVSLEGPKWCGKTWTALNHAREAVFLNNTQDNFRLKKLAEMDVDLVLHGKHPLLIDEWQEVPAIWDAVRFHIDQSPRKGQYLLTGSATPVTDQIHHSGAGRICKMSMGTMSLYETGDSSGVVSLGSLFTHTVRHQRLQPTSIQHYAELIIRGGWPENINTTSTAASRITNSYIQAILEKDIYTIDNVQRDGQKMLMLMRSLARNETAIVSNNTLLTDISENSNERDLELSRNTLADYLDILQRLHLLANQPAFSYNVRSSIHVGKSPKRHFVDPSLAAGLLQLTPEKLLCDLRTFGLLFESLVEHDLRIYAEYLGARLYHYRDNKSGLEVDAIIEIADGEYGAIEIKLGSDSEEAAAASLHKFADSMRIKPKFLAIICGLYDAVIRRPDGIYIFPPTALKP